MSLHSQACSLCSRGLLDINPPEFGSSSSRVDWHGAASRLRRVQLQRRFRKLCTITPLGSRWDRRRFAVTNERQEAREAGREVKLNDDDLMTLEFGRLLGESKDKTLSKVVGKKMEPDATYLEIEKVARKGNQSKLSSKPDIRNYQVHVDKPKRSAVHDAARLDTGSATPKLHFLASPPVRRNVVAGKVSQFVQDDSNPAAPSIKGLQMEADESVDESLLRKPSFSKTSTDGMTSVLPVGKVISHVSMSMKMPNVESSNDSNGKLKHQDLALDSTLEELLLQKPSLDQRQTDSIAVALPTGTARHSLSRSMQGQTMKLSARESSSDDVHLCRPSVKDSKTSSTSTGGQNRTLMDDELMLNSRAASLRPEDFKISEKDEKNSLPMSQFAMIPELQDDLSCDGSEFEVNDKLEKSAFEPSEKTFYADKPEQIHAHDDPSLMLNIKVLEQETLSSNFRQSFDQEPFIPIPKQKQCEEGPLVEASASLDAGSHNNMHRMPSQADDLANGSKLYHKSAVSLQTRVQNFRVEKVQAPRRPEKIEVTASERTDTPSKPNPNSLADSRDENRVARQDERESRNSDILSTSAGDSMASLLIQDLPSAMSSEERRSKQHLLNPNPHKAVLDGFFPSEYAEDVSVTKQVLDNTVGQSREILRKPKQYPQEDEESDWTRAEAFLKSKTQLEVTVIGGNTATLTVAFGCLLGFVPHFELSPKIGLVEFSSWAQQKGFNVSWSKELKNGDALDSDCQDTSGRKIGKDGLILATDGDIKDLRNNYNKEIISSYVGKKIRVIIKSVNKSARRLKFSEKEVDLDSREVAQKKADLMAELKVGDVINCEVRSITPIGVFVELNGVSALIHHSEVSWNTGVDPHSLLKIGEVIKARVCRLDPTLQRINLSLKQMQCDPLMETLESVVRDLEGETQEPQSIESQVVEWPELEVLIRQLEQMQEIKSVSKGRCLCSTALAPAFQVFLSTSQDSGYKLLTRLGNQIQEVLVDTTMDREKMKESIRVCTFTET